jgi:hypothetical protein
MPTVIGDDGKEYEVVQVEAVAALSSVARLSGSDDLPPDASKRIESAMSRAVYAMMEQGVSDPEKIREAMQDARAREKIYMRNEIIDKRSQEAAGQ